MENNIVHLKFTLEGVYLGTLPLHKHDAENLPILFKGLSKGEKIQLQDAVQEGLDLMALTDALILQEKESAKLIQNYARRTKHFDPELGTLYDSKYQEISLDAVTMLMILPYSRFSIFFPYTLHEWTTRITELTKRTYFPEILEMIIRPPRKIS